MKIGHKLTEDQVSQVLHMLEEGKSQEEIAEIFNITQGMVSLIKNRKRWSQPFIVWRTWPFGK